MQEEDLYTEGELIAQHLREIRMGSPSQRGYHFQELRRLMPASEAEKIINREVWGDLLAE